MKDIEYFLIDPKELKQIRMYRLPIDAGSDITCYPYDLHTVIKIFEITCNSPKDKLFLPHNKYGNNSYSFVNKVGINKDDLIICYTMPYIRGEKLNVYNFNELSIETLLSFIKIFLKDTHNISQNGIYTYDNFISNIILNRTGFHNIDPIDFQIIDKDPTLIEKDNIQIFFTNFWEYLLNNNLRDFCTNHKLSKEFLYTDPISFFTELTNTVSSTYNQEITSIKQIKILTKKK